MIHKIKIPFPAKKIRYPNKPVFVYDFDTPIGEAVVFTQERKKVAETGLNEPYLLVARGNFVIRDGDIIDEYKIISFEIDKN